ncbi:MAG: 30S ribosome-binding factor RbfA [Phycisphaerales bacterium]|nr:30S ribosome-binding factor RbfA [Phycisphaerales bacterium]
MKRRAQQISSTMQRELQKVIAKGFNDPRIRGLITVTKVELTDDLKNAKAYISVLPQERADLTMHGLRAAGKRIRRDVMDRIHLKEMPTLRFEYDHGMREQQVISELLASDPFRKDTDGDPEILVEPSDGSMESTNPQSEDGDPR